MQNAVVATDFRPSVAPHFATSGYQSLPAVHGEVVQCSDLRRDDRFNRSGNGSVRTLRFRQELISEHVRLTESSRQRAPPHPRSQCG